MSTLTKVTLGTITAIMLGVAWFVYAEGSSEPSAHGDRPAQPLTDLAAKMPEQPPARPQLAAPLAAVAVAHTKEAPPVAVVMPKDPLAPAYLPHPPAPELRPPPNPFVPPQLETDPNRGRLPPQATPPPPPLQ